MLDFDALSFVVSEKQTTHDRKNRVSGLKNA